MALIFHQAVAPLAPHALQELRLQNLFILKLANTAVIIAALYTTLIFPIFFQEVAIFAELAFSLGFADGAVLISTGLDPPRRLVVSESLLDFLALVQLRSDARAAILVTGQACGSFPLEKPTFTELANNFPVEVLAAELAAVRAGLAFEFVILVHHFYFVELAAVAASHNQNHQQNSVSPH